MTLKRAEVFPCFCLGFDLSRLGHNAYGTVRFITDGNQFLLYFYEYHLIFFGEILTILF